MPKAVFVVFSNPSDAAHDDEFNAWYNGSHVPDVLKGVDGMRSATRYKRADTQLLTRNAPPDHQYLVVWEIEADSLDEVRDQLRGMQGKTAHSDAMVYMLAREPFLTAILGHAATQRQAHGIAEARLAADAARGGDNPAAGTVGPG